MNNPDPLLGQQLGSYRLLQALGRGSFAQVYLGQHIHLHTYVAIKVLHAQLGIQEEQEFRKEALLLVRFKHPHIVRLLDYGITNNRPFIIMELARKGALNKMYLPGSRLPILEVVAYATQIADGLDYAHKQNVVHRDIKPENILVGDNDELLLADFGIARLLSTSHSNIKSNTAGTVAYMAPEQIIGQPGPASDQYALAVMVYGWLAGRLPFQGTIAEVMGQHLKSSPLPLRQFNPGISADIEWAVLTALKKEPAQRFREVRAFANALKQAAKIETTQLTRIKPVLQEKMKGSNPNAQANQQVVRQSSQGNMPASSNSGTPPPKPAMLYLKNTSPLPFTELPSLPQAHVTDFWWPTFIVTIDERRAINQTGLPSEQLGTLGMLTGFPSQPVPLPISTTVEPPRTGNVQNIQRISEVVQPQHAGSGQTSGGTGQPGSAGVKPPVALRVSTSGGGPQPTAQTTGAQAGAQRTTGKPQQGTSPTSSQQKTASASTAAWIGTISVFLLLGVICTISAASSPNQAAIIWSWIFVSTSLTVNMAASTQAQKNAKMKGWLIFFLILAIVLLVINIPVQINVNSY